MGGRGLVVGLVGVLAAVLVSGCTSDAHPAASRTPTAPATGAPTASPTPTGLLTTGPGVRPGEKPPILNKAATVHDSTGAISYGRYFVQALDWSLATTDPYLLVQAGLPSCQTCARYESRLTSLATKGGYLRGGRIVIHEVGMSTETFEMKSEYAIAVQFDQGPDTVIVPHSKPSADTTKTSTFTAVVLLSWVSGRWRVVEMELQ